MQSFKFIQTYIYWAAIKCCGQSSDLEIVLRSSNSMEMALPQVCPVHWAQNQVPGRPELGGWDLASEISFLAWVTSVGKLSWLTLDKKL